VISSLDTYLRLGAIGFVVFAIMSCTDAPESGPIEAGASIKFVHPEDGSTIEGNAVTLRLEASGIEIVPAGTMEHGTGHHHFAVDIALPEAGAPIPTIEGTYIHLGQAQTEYELKGLSPGEHVVIAVVGDGSHIPVDPWVVDTIRFVVP
jgi:hypothetical protein